MNPENMDYLVMSRIWQRVKAEDLGALLEAGRPLLLITRSAKRRFIADPLAFAKAEDWATATAKGYVYVEACMERFYCSEHLTDDALPLLPVPFEQVFKPEVIAAPAAPAQTELQLENKPAEATTQE